MLKFDKDKGLFYRLVKGKKKYIDNIREESFPLFNTKKSQENSNV